MAHRYHTSAPSEKHALGASGILILLVSGIYAVVVRPRINQWGATDQ